MGEDRTGRPDPTNQRVTVSEAAEQLGITAEAVRMRIKRGTLRSERQAGRVFVLLGQSQPTEQPTDRPDEPNALISQMQERIASLERQLDQEREANSEHRRLLLRALERIPPQLEARESPETVAEEREMAESPRSAVESQEPVRRAWWRRMFGG